MEQQGRQAKKKIIEQYTKYAVNKRQNKNQPYKKKKQGRAKRNNMSLLFAHLLRMFAIRFDMLSSLDSEKRKFYRSYVPEFLGTQQPTFRLRTGFTTLTTTATPNLVTVIGMDSSGITQWTGLAAIFDEYRILKAKLHVQPTYQSFGASATAIAAMPVICVVDYDDATALSSLTNAIQYDTARTLYMGASNCKTHIVEARPEGQPDLAWVTTASPTIPFYWKFWSVSTLIPTSLGMGYAYIEVEIEFRQVG